MVVYQVSDALARFQSFCPSGCILGEAIRMYGLPHSLAENLLQEEGQIAFACRDPHSTKSSVRRANTDSSPQKSNDLHYPAL